MSVALLVLALVPAEGPGSARWRCEPQVVEVGQPFELVLELRHAPERAALALFEGDPQLDESWVLFARHDVLELERGPEQVTSRVSWSLASLEPGSRDLSEALARVAFVSEVGAIAVGEARVEVRGVLAEGEDAPRGLRLFPSGFLDLEPREAGGGPWAWLLLLPPLALGAWLLLRRRRRPSPVRAPDDLERLDELARGAAQDAAGGCFALTRLLREAADRGRGARRDGLTDEEWLGELRAARAVSAPAVEDLERVFARAERVKYAGERVTPWALDELFVQARQALRTLGTPAADGGGRP